jgi:predicted nucleic acid-binding protein
MILAETTIVIDFLRAPTPRLLKIIQDNQAAICGVTLAEVYCGARTPADFGRFDAALSVYASIAVPLDIWPRLGRNLATLAGRGITVPFPDALIATVAIDHDVEVWHHDAHFPLMQLALPQLDCSWSRPERSAA